MAFPDVVTREQWLAARTELLAAEKEATRSRDALNARRRQLPLVRIDQGRQLIIQHVMFGPSWERPARAACRRCRPGSRAVRRTPGATGAEIFARFGLPAELP